MSSPPFSRLTSDYINHFVELVMLLEMLPDSPGLIEEAKAWTPRTYLEHLDQIKFTSRIALREGYEELAAPRRDLLERAAADANRLGAAIAAILGDSGNSPTRLEAITRIGCAAMHAHIRRLTAILSGKPVPVIDRDDSDLQGEIDALIAAA